MPFFRKNQGKPKVEQRDNYGFSHAWTAGEDVLSRGVESVGVGSLSLSIVHGCVTRIANRISAMPLVLEKESDLRPLWLDTPDPFANPGWGLTMRDVVNQIVTSLLIDGNAFIGVGRAQGIIQEIQVLNPRACVFKRQDGEIILEVDGSEPDFDVLVIRNIVLPGEVRGLSPIESCQRLVEIGLGGQEVASRYHEQALNLPGVITSQSEITQNQVQQLLGQLQARHGGSKKSHLPLVLGQASWQSIGFDSQQAQFLESRHFSDAQIAAHIFHLDPSLMGNPAQGSSDVYQNVEMRSYEMLVNALLPLMERIENGFNMLLNEGLKVKFDYDEQLRGDVATRYRTYEASAKISQLLGQPLMTINEMREREGLPPIEGGDEMPQKAPMVITPPVDAEGMPPMSQSGKDASGKKVEES